MNNTKSRKNSKPLILVAMLLMIALVLGMGAMTYSKYVSEQKVPAKQATAAKWGYVVTVNAENLFGSAYESGVTTTVNAATNEVLATADIGGNRGLVVAPGTSGYMTITVTGSSEVRAALTIDVVGTPEEIYLKKNGSEDYYPVVWTLTNESTTPATELESGKLSDVIAKLESASSTLNPGGTASVNYKLSWEWADHVDAATDTKDTAIGLYATSGDVAAVNTALGLNDANKVTECNPDLTFEIIVKVEQVTTNP